MMSLRMGFAVAGILAFPACSPSPPSEATSQAADVRPDQIAADSALVGGHNEYVEEIRAIPSYGGHLFEGCALVVQVADPKDTAEARAYFEQEFRNYQSGARRSHCTSPPSILVRPVRYSFAQLQRWYNFHLDLSGIEGITFTDIDESRNRLVVGVENVAAGERVQQRISQLNLPSGVVIVEEFGPICPAVSTAAVNVRVRDARTHRVPQREVTLVVREGSYTDSLTRRFVGEEDPGWLGAAWDRAGTYQVVVRAPGYRAWIREGVQVPEGTCGAESVVLPVALEPAARLYR